MAKDLHFGPIVSSAHLAAGAMPALSEFEFGLILAGHAFQRWMVRCMAAAGVPDASALEVLIMHTVHHRNKGKRLSDIALVLNIEDMHLVTYAIKKLEAAKLVTSKKIGKEKLVLTTPRGAEVCQKYTEIREALLVKSARTVVSDSKLLSGIAAELRALSGLYDQAARSAASL